MTDLVSLKLKRLVPEKDFEMPLPLLLDTSAKAQFMLPKMFQDIMGAH